MEELIKQGSQMVLCRAFVKSQFLLHVVISRELLNGHHLLTDNHFCVVSLNSQISLSLISSHVTAVLMNQNTGNFQNIIKYCENSWYLRENFPFKEQSCLQQQKTSTSNSNMTLYYDFCICQNVLYREQRRPTWSLESKNSRDKTHCRD